ncbi:MAG: HEAT repeat domain-containing protein [Planctomycetes bacterium]|nr:HEAT repeat domain-containing protein [Planctomycetota bacterium]
MRVFLPIFTLPFILLALPAPASPGQGETAVAAVPVTPAQTQLSEQLELNKNSLYNDPKEDIRVKTANLLLFSPDPLARRILLEALEKRDHVAAYGAICKALSQTRANAESLPEKGDFLISLIEAVKDAKPDVSRLAADALLIYEYQQVGGALETTVRDESLDQGIRLNVMEALGMRPDKGAAITLVAMVDDPNPQISAAAKFMLQSIGIPVGKDVSARRLITIDLQNKSRDEFHREWLVRLQGNLKQEAAQTALWRGLYLQTLDALYATMSDDSVRSTFLTEHMQSPHSQRKLWALDKVYQWRLGPGTTPPDTIVPVLLGLVADSDRSVRLAAAKQLSYSGHIESARSLLDQLQAESDAEVKTEIFVALGAACKSALLRDGIPPGIKKETLEWAAKYLDAPDAARATKGADVIGKLMEQNGLAPEETEEFLKLLRARYEREAAGDSTLRGDLLRTMAGLCVNRSACKQGARTQFRQVFADALQDKSDRVREEGIEGLVNIDRENALQRLRSDFANDSSAKIRGRLIALAEELGGPEDVFWLIPKLGTNGEAEAAFRTLLAIISRSEAALLEDQWFAELLATRHQKKLSDSQWRSLLEQAERMAEGRAEFLQKIYREWTVLLSSGGSLTDQAAYWEKLVESTPEGLGDEDSATLLGIYIRLGRVKASVGILQNLLIKGDLAPNGPIVGVLSGFSSQSGPDGRFAETVRVVVASVTVSEERPVWDAQKKRWLPPAYGAAEKGAGGSTDGPGL